MNWNRVVDAAIGSVVTAVLAGAGITAVQQTAAPTVPSASYATVVQGLARLNAESREELSRCACKYRHAAGEAVERGWQKPRLRQEWDLLCTQEDEVATR